MSSFTSASDSSSDCDHAVDRVAPAAADADDLDHREVVLRSAEHGATFPTGQGPKWRNDDPPAVVRLHLKLKYRLTIMSPCGMR
jgi:hypothetical protein